MKVDHTAKEEPTVALAVAGLATLVYLLFAVAMALCSPRTPPGLANPAHPSYRLPYFSILEQPRAALRPKALASNMRGRAFLRCFQRQSRLP